jgi:hypothetical protein
LLLTASYELKACIHSRIIATVVILQAAKSAQATAAPDKQQLRVQEGKGRVERGRRWGRRRRGRM